MRKPGFFIFMLILFYSSLTAQSTNVRGEWAATLTGALIPISQPGLGIQPGISYRINDHYSILAEVAFRANKKDSKDSSELNKQYLRIKSEVRYCFSAKGKRSHLYTGLQVSRASRKFINQNSYYYDNRSTDSGYYYSKASINSPVTTFSVQFGSIINFHDQIFSVDLFAGIGARFITTTIADIENPVRSAVSRPADGPSFTPSYSYAGNVIMFHLNGGLRLMWNFSRVKHPGKQ